MHRRHLMAVGGLWALLVITFVAGQRYYRWWQWQSLALVSRVVPLADWQSGYMVVWGLLIPGACLVGATHCFRRRFGPGSFLIAALYCATAAAALFVVNMFVPESTARVPNWVMRRYSETMVVTCLLAGVAASIIAILLYARATRGLNRKQNQRAN
jgi:hypothetical protein